MELLDDSFWQNLYEVENTQENDYWTFDTPVEDDLNLDIGFGYQMPMKRDDMEIYLQTQLDDPLAPDVLQVVRLMVSPFIGESDEFDLKCLDYSTLSDLYSYMQGVEKDVETKSNDMLKSKSGIKKKQPPKKKKAIKETVVAPSPTPSVEESVHIDFDMPASIQ